MTTSNFPCQNSPNVHHNFYRANDKVA